MDLYSVSEFPSLSLLEAYHSFSRYYFSDACKILFINFHITTNI